MLRLFVAAVLATLASTANATPPEMPSQIVGDWCKGTGSLPPAAERGWTSVFSYDKTNGCRDFNVSRTAFSWSKYETETCTPLSVNTQSVYKHTFVWIVKARCHSGEDNTKTKTKTFRFQASIFTPNLAELFVGQKKE
jgi:hypothetical protein